MPRKKIAAANTESLEVAQDVVDTTTVYYEYTTRDGTHVLLDRYEWIRVKPDTLCHQDERFQKKIIKTINDTKGQYIRRQEKLIIKMPAY